MSAKYTFAVYDTIVGSAKEKLVLLKLADNANDEGVCWPAMGYLQNHTELSRSSLLRALKSLEEKGFLTITRRKSDDGKQNLSNIYKLILPSAIVTPPSVILEPPQCHGDTRGSVILTPKPNNIEPNNKYIYTNKITSADIEQVIEGYNAVITNLKPNWQKMATLSDKRKTMVKSALNLVKQRSEKRNESPADYIVRLLEVMATDDFFSGHPNQRNPNGYNCPFETTFRQERICQAIDKYAGEK